AFTLKKLHWFDEKNIDLFLGTPVTGLDPQNRTITTAKRKKIGFTSLVLATGSSPFVPLPKALDLPGVFTCRTLTDARKIEEAAMKASSVVIIGGGLLGLEAAHFLSLDGQREVTVVEMVPRILPRQLDETVASWLATKIQAAGVNLRMGTLVSEINYDDGHLTLTTPQETITADMILFSIGVRARTDLAQAANIAVERGILVNQFMETSVAGIYACGDVAQRGDVQIPLWLPAARMGQVAGHNALSVEKQTWEPPVSPAALSAFGTRIFSAGTLSGTLLEKVDNPEQGAHLYFEDNRLSGALLWGDTNRGMALVRAMEAQTPRTEVETLLA
ncbi:FAD-dependent oxidoreductase, partial [Myxococcota bacterium]|nr:FAD-dependent oxidoreductase [Myxococcota bacterium]